MSKFEICRQRDVVIFRDGANLVCGDVLFFAACNDEPIPLISVWGFESADEAQGTITVVIADDATTCIHVNDIEASCFYRRKPDGRAQVLVPPTLRGRVA